MRELPGGGSSTATPIPAAALLVMQELVAARKRIYDRANGASGTAPDEIDRLHIDYLAAQFNLVLLQAGILPETL